MKKFASIFKNKEIVGRIFFTIMILFVIRIGAAITVPGVKTTSSFTDAMNSGNAIAMMNLLGGGALSNFSVFALGVSPYITSQIIVQLLSKDVLPALTELSKQGQYGRKKIEMATRYLTLLLGAVQAYGIIMMMQNSSYISLTLSTSGGGAFWTYLYIITVLLAGAMLTMWLGDQITEKGLGNGISIIIFAGCVRSLPIQISTAWEKWVAANLRIADSTAIIRGSFQFALYIVALLAIVTGVVFVAVFGPGRPRALHPVLFVVLGWCGLFFLPRMLRENLPLFLATLAGGVVYTLGIIPFAIKKKGSHFLWHFFVFFGAVIHWFGIYLFLYA